MTNVKLFATTHAQTKDNIPLIFKYKGLENRNLFHQYKEHGFLILFSTINILIHVMTSNVHRFIYIDQHTQNFHTYDMSYIPSSSNEGSCTALHTCRLTIAFATCIHKVSRAGKLYCSTCHGQWKFLTSKVFNLLNLQGE